MLLAQFKQNKSLTFLVSLLLLILVYPFFEASRVTSVVFIILYTTVLLSGVYAISYDARYVALGMLLITPILVCQWSNIILNSPAIDMFGRACAAVFMMYTLFALLERVLTARRVGLNEIYGAVCAYVLIGTVFGIFYLLIEAASPGAFRFSHDAGPYGPAAFIYFSFVTLSTAGFGDIVAVLPFARSLVIIEIIIGVAYVAVLIGRLISASQSGREEEEETGKPPRKAAVREISLPLRKRPVGLVAAAVMLNFAASLLLMQLRLPFFFDGTGTSLAVLLGGFWPGAAAAVLYNLLIAGTLWGWSSWVWMFSSLLVAAATWFFYQRGWVTIYKPYHLIAAGIATGILNGILVQATTILAHLPPYEGTMRVYSFFLSLTGHQAAAAIAEKMFVEIADKTVSIMVAAAVVYFLHDLMGTTKALKKNAVGRAS
ncbi:MAG TPA: potassium channel family protein [Verrucomicrobiae bacterium]|jgi:hypothetical protein|nr:potassium channel family protein [Verrucomicrobiae bacterium]